MKKTSAILVSLLAEFNAEDFYAISFRRGEIRLQGFFSEALMKDLQKFKYELEIAPNGFQNFSFKYEGIDVAMIITQKK